MKGFRSSRPESISFLILSSIIFSLVISTGKISEGLILHLTFDEGSGYTTYDHSGNGNNGIINGASWMDGILGNALEFNEGDWVNCGDDSVFDVEVFTIEAWIYIYGSTGSSHQILSKFLTEGQILDDAYIFELWTDSQRLVLTLSLDGDPHWVECYASERLNFNVWTFVSGTYDGSVMKIYKNSSEIGTSKTSIPIRKTSAPVMIGNHYNISGNFNGRMDEIRMYNRALTSEEILDDYKKSTISTQIPLNTISGFFILLLIVISLSFTVRRQRSKLSR